MDALILVPEGTQVTNTDIENVTSECIAGERRHAVWQHESRGADSGCDLTQPHVSLYVTVTV